MDEQAPLLRLSDVSVTFGRGERVNRALRGVSLDLFRGETLALVGESGSGKSTVGRAIIRATPISGGEIRLEGERISGRLPRSRERALIRKIQMVFQDPAASLNERATVDYIVSEGLYNFHLYSDEEDRKRRVMEMIRRVGLLPEHLSRYPHEFSGGQRQRIGIARAMIMEPRLVIADEPISALDVSMRAEVLNLLREFGRERGVSFLFVAHDLSVVRRISDRIAVIYRGRIVEIAPTEELFLNPQHPYTLSLLSAIPIPDPILERRKRRILYEGREGEEDGELVDLGGGHLVRKPSV